MKIFQITSKSTGKTISKIFNPITKQSFSAINKGKIMGGNLPYAFLNEIYFSKSINKLLPSWPNYSASKWRLAGLAVIELKLHKGANLFSVRGEVTLSQHPRLSLLAMVGQAYGNRLPR